MRIAVREPGGAYLWDGLDLQWPRGGGERSFADVPDDRDAWSPRLRKAFEAGQVVAIEQPKTVRKAVARKGRKRAQ